MWTITKKIYFVLYNMFGRFWFESAKLRLGMEFRRFWAKRICTSVGVNVNIEKGAYFTPELRIGDNSGIGVNCEMHGDISIGKNVMMAPEVIIYTKGHNISDIDKPMITQGNNESKPVVLGDDIWIGRRAIILPGVHIHEGAVIGAGAVVTKDVDSYCVIAGNPGKVVRKRN